MNTTKTHTYISTKSAKLESRFSVILSVEPYKYLCFSFFFFVANEEIKMVKLCQIPSISADQEVKHQVNRVFFSTFVFILTKRHISYLIDLLNTYENCNYFDLFLIQNNLKLSSGLVNLELTPNCTIKPVWVYANFPNIWIETFKWSEINE